MLVYEMVLIDSAAVPNAAPLAQSKDLEAEIDGLLDGLDDSTSAESPATYGGEEVMPPRTLGRPCTLTHASEPLGPTASKHASWKHGSAMMTCAFVRAWASWDSDDTSQLQHSATQRNRIQHNTAKDNAMKCNENSKASCKT
jgi:hypothetical protein